ncbi:MAG: hypothetical protein VCA18_00950 [Opitutales bacterium]
MTRILSAAEQMTTPCVFTRRRRNQWATAYLKKPPSHGRSVMCSPAETDYCTFN